MISILSIKKKVEIACSIKGISVTELAKRLGTSQPNLTKRLNTGKFTQEELAKIANELDCEYKPQWILPDGQIIE